ncbi:MAG: ribosome small subunit-dependent GTPase A [Melioribacteraceae bacterium]|nr:ribosome small subunit-dependent GTPase A [Melioribacteraceae bacterium]MCF8355505.1 ribosome small subunit-dependent GTPase A [Melioribacteraceae bacterium]MCF8394193.1 ribosome small subunit-dependent GTPase A [Melioribacteraceae bacterium]MCF8419913.1 ribosome small subunit-dependent GTPase A [Melioribacteraceae bacterium]
MEGKVLRSESKDYYVLNRENKEIRCTLRGKFKKEFNLKKDKSFKLDFAVVGDMVEYEMNRDGTGVIYKIAERKNYISRKAPRIKGASYRGERLEQIVSANVDQLFIISSLAKPKFNNKLIDRLIVVGESSHIDTHIILNKIDLENENAIEDWERLYNDLGYKFHKTSVVNKDGIEEVKNSLKGKTNLFWGQSGVGKSSLLNMIYPDLNLKTGAISNSTNKGTHTTVTSVMHKIDDDTFVIDTPGIREMDPYGIMKQDLSHYFIEFNEYSHNCKFNTCTHYHEPGCEVVKAVENGMITKERYESYLNLLDTVEDDMIF